MECTPVHRMLFMTSLALVQYRPTGIHSLASPRRRTLFEECSRPFGCVLRLADSCSKSGLSLEHLIGRPVGRSVDDFLRHSKRQRCIASNGSGEVRGTLERKPFCHYTVDESEAQPIGCSDRLARQCDVQGNVSRNSRGQPQETTGRCNETSLDLRQTEGRILSCHNQIGGQGDLETTPECVTFDSSDGRLSGRATDDAECASPRRDRSLSACSKRLQIHSCRERATGAGQHDHPYIAIPFRLVDSSLEQERRI